VGAEIGVAKQNQQLHEVAARLRSAGQGDYTIGPRERTTSDSRSCQITFGSTARQSPSTLPG